MDTLHSDIFGRPSVTGSKIVGYWKSFKSVELALDAIDDKQFAYYNLTKYFLAYSVANVIRTNTIGATMLNNMEGIISSGRLSELTDIIESLARSLAYDLNAEIEVDESDVFDYKNELKSPTWCKKISARLIAQYSKDVVRKKAEPLDVLCLSLSEAK